MMAMETVTVEAIRAARVRIGSKIRLTPIDASSSLSQRTGAPVFLKMEHRQTTGSFKLRGASNAITQLGEAEKTKGVVAASTGNHGRALAHAAGLEGIRAVICMSRLVPDNKVAEIRRLGAEVHIVGDSQDDAQAEVERLVKEDGLAMVPPFDDHRVIAGQGTLGLEMMDAVPTARTIVVQLSGGGLAAGIAAAVKAVAPKTRVIGVSMTRGAAMKASLDAGQPIDVKEMPTLADSLGGGIGLHNRLTFAMCRALLDDVVLLTEDEIAAGVAHAYREEREVVEGAGAVGIAAILAGKIRLDGETIVLLSGRNIDMTLHRSIVCGTWRETREAG